MKRVVHPIIILLLALAAHASADAETNALDTVRLLAVVPRTFGYRFMSYMGDTPGRHRLVFNTPAGETAILQPGDRLDDYTVGTFTPQTQQVFNPAVQATVQRKSGTVELIDPDGDRITLTMGRALEIDGWTACLVDTVSGDWRYVNAGDRLVRGDGIALQVLAVTEGQAVLSDGATEQIPPKLDDTEYEAIATLWASRAARHREALAAATRDPEPDVLQTAPFIRPRPAPLLEAPMVRTPPALPPRVITIQTGPPRYHFGTDYPWPIAFQVVRIPVRTASGQVGYRYVQVPVQFERRVHGIGAATSTFITGSY